MTAAKKRNVIMKDIVVVGGGMSGICAAISAAREDYDVLIIEREHGLGGTSTLGLQGQLNGCFLRGQRVLSSLGWEIVQSMMSKGLATMKYNVAMSPNPEIKVDKAYINSEELEVFLKNLTEEENVEVVYGYRIKDIYEVKDAILIEAQNEDTLLEVRCKRIIDASGYGYVFDKLGFKVTEIPEGKRQVCSLLFNIGGIDREIFDELTGEEIGKIAKEGFEKKKIPSKVFQLFPIPGRDEIGVNATRVKVDTFTEENVKKGYETAKAQIPLIIEYIKENVPGCKNAYLKKIAPILGIRLHRAIKGNYTLTKEDVLKGAYFKDGVTMCCYPSDMQLNKEDTNYFTIGAEGYYEIPYSAMINDECPYVIACGKSISADEYAYASLRVVPTVMATGEIAGIAAALSLDKDLPLNKIDINTIREKSMSSRLLLER